MAFIYQTLLNKLHQLSPTPYQPLAPAPTWSNNLPLYKLFIAFTVIMWCVETYIDYRQYRTYLLKSKPAELTHINNKEFSDAQAYGRDKSRFSFVTSAFGPVKLIAELQLGFYPLLWQYSGQILQSIAPAYVHNEIAHTIVFFLVNHVIELPLDIPFSLYSTFVIEARHGFNKQTIGLWVTDQLKGLALFVVIGSPLLALFLWVILSTGQHFYLYVCSLVLFVQVVGIIVYPTLIQPLFNKVTTLEHGTLRDQIEKQAKAVNYTLASIYKIDGSKRSSHSNAYQYGWGSSKKIVLFDTLMDQCNIAEAVAIVTHELGHWFHNHVLKSLAIAQVTTLLTFYLFSLTHRDPHLVREFGFQSTASPLTGQPPAFLSLLLFQFIYSPVSHVFGLLMNIVSRHAEYQADEFAVKLDHADGLKSGLRTIHSKNKSRPISDALYSMYHDSHPTLLQRLTRIDELSKRLV